MKLQIAGLEKYEAMISPIPEDELPEGVSKDSVLINQVLMGRSLRIDLPDTAEERRRVSELIDNNAEKIAEKVGVKHFKLILKG